jgi:hypothetical protein
MTNSTDSEFDPRFDPAFQPGFDPARHRPGPAEPPRSPRVQTQQQTDDFQPAARVAPPPVVAVDPLAPAEQPTPAEPISADDVSAALRRVDPYLVALWVISALLIGGGTYSLRLIGDRIRALTSSGDFGGPGYYLLQAFTIGAPMLIVLGIATAIGTVFLLAARSRRGAPPRRVSDS